MHIILKRYEFVNRTWQENGGQSEAVFLSQNTQKNAAELLRGEFFGYFALFDILQRFALGYLRNLSHLKQRDNNIAPKPRKEHHSIGYRVD